MPAGETLSVALAPVTPWPCIAGALQMARGDGDGVPISVRFVGSTTAVTARVVRLSRRQPATVLLRLRLARNVDGRETLAVRAPGDLWAARYGCDEPISQTLPWDPPAGRDLRPWVDRALGAAESGPADVVFAIEPSPADRILTLGEVATVLRVLHEDCGLAEPRLTPELHVRANDAVELALKWLAARQSETGAWPSEADDVAATGSALCAFLGAGYTNRGNHPFAMVISKGVKWLKSRQGADGSFRSADGSWNAVSHDLATLALVQGYGMTESPFWAGAAGNAYAVRATMPAPRHDPFFDGVDAILEETTHRIAAQAVSRGVPCPWSDGGAVDLSVLLVHRDRLRHDGAAFAWFTTVARDQLDPGTWLAWSEGPLRARVAAQREGGASCYGGSWDPSRDEPLDRIETTAVSALALEIWYQYDHAPPGRAR